MAREIERVRAVEEFHRWRDIDRWTELHTGRHELAALPEIQLPAVGRPERLQSAFDRHNRPGPGVRKRRHIHLELARFVAHVSQRASIRRKARRPFIGRTGQQGLCLPAGRQDPDVGLVVKKLISTTAETSWPAVRSAVTTAKSQLSSARKRTGYSLLLRVSLPMKTTSSWASVSAAYRIAA